MFEKTITDVDGRAITLDTDDFYDTVTASHDGKLVGKFEFSTEGGSLHILHLDMELSPGFKHKRIGRQMLAFMKELSGLEITHTPMDGIAREDGSNLVADGQPFVQEMINLGLVRDCNDSGRGIWDED